MAKDLDFPTIFLLPTHFDADELPALESLIPTLTYDINEAQIILGKVSKKLRALLELRTRKLFTDEISSEPHDEENPVSTEPSAKRRKLSPSNRRASASGESTASDTDERTGEDAPNGDPVGTKPSTKALEDADKSVVKVVRLAWFTESLSKGEVLPVNDYLVYQGRKKIASAPSQPVLNPDDILKSARQDDHGSLPASQPQFSQGYTHHPRTNNPKRPHLLQETTSEHEISKRLPPIPDYMNSIYSCQRSTPSNCPNEAFVEELKKIRTLRILEGDDVGVRAYSTSIAALAAYPYHLSSAAGESISLSPIGWWSLVT